MKKGFTLVELLAVIVILAVILVIAVPQINNVIKETRKNSLGSTAKLIAAKAEEKEVENDALEISGSITCEDLVKLDSNYGNCIVTKNASGKWVVTIVGANKFSGYTCTGTKDNMSCTERDTNTPEYVYSFKTPYYEYTVTDKDACKTYFINEGELEEEAISVCNGNGSEAVGITTSEILSHYPSEDISSFAERSSVLVGAVEDYTTLKYPNTNEQVQIFTRWSGDTVNFDENDNPETCMLLNENVTCLKKDTYANNKLHLDEMFGSSNCELGMSGSDKTGVEIYSCTKDGFKCSTSAVDGSFSCSHTTEGNTYVCSASACHLQLIVPGLLPIDVVPGGSQ